MGAEGPIGFEQPPTRIGSSRARLSIAAVLVASIAIVGFAIAGKGLESPAATAEATPFGSAGAIASPSLGLQPSALTADQPAASTATPEPAIRSLPDDIECKGVDYDSCLLLAVAAIRSLPEPVPPIRSASVWKSLLCDSTLDCPPSLLKAVVPLGSVVLTFDDGTTWMNVVGRRTATATTQGSLRLEAWSVR